MRCYWEYFKYVMKHKQYMFIACVKRGMFLHAITHDLSKFYLDEFIPFARRFNGTVHQQNMALSDGSFDRAWNHHQKRNKHHWNYWVLDDGEVIPMPRKYIRQMHADWEAMSKKKGDTPKEFFMANVDKFNMHEDTLAEIARLVCMEL